MKSVLANIRDAIEYAFSDKYALVIISAIMAITSFITKDNTILHPFYKLTTVTLLFIMGYGSYISWYTLKGSDKHPKVRNNIIKLTWEGFKKTFITTIYSIGITFFYYSILPNVFTIWRLLFKCSLGLLLNINQQHIE